MNFLLSDDVKLRTDVILADRDTGNLFCDKLRQIFIALPRFKKEEDECTTDFERWIYILTNMETLKRLPFKARKAVFERLEKIADVASLTKEERELYENSVDAYRTHLCVMDAAKLEGHEEGRKEGLEEGLKEGLGKGREEGLKEGREQERLANARAMREKGIADSLIMDITGLTREELDKL